MNYTDDFPPCFQLAHHYKFGLEQRSYYPNAPGTVLRPASYFSLAAQ